MRLEDIRDVQTACGGAGLGVAFNAPMGGALFVFEEVDRRFGMRLTLATLLAAGTAISVSRYLLGAHVELPIAALPDAQPHELIPYALLGILLGFAGLAYNRSVILALDVHARLLPLWTPEAKAAVVGGTVGLVASFVPPLVGGGETLSLDVLHGTVPLTMLLMLFVLRWLLGALCYAPGAPGGLFAPLLLVGAIGGACFAMFANRMLPMLDLDPASFAVVAMAAFFTAIVRAPLTGIVLVIEMTAATSMIVPSFIACFSAMFTASVLRGEPIYDSLRTRMLPARTRTED
jgi:CIC family chloride channel protein